MRCPISALLLVASNRGISVLPDWVLRDLNSNADYITRPITEQGMTRRLFAAMREDEASAPYMAAFLKLAREIPIRMQRA